MLLDAMLPDRNAWTGAPYIYIEEGGREIGTPLRLRYRYKKGGMRQGNGEGSVGALHGDREWCEGEV